MSAAGSCLTRAGSPAKYVYRRQCTMKPLDTEKLELPLKPTWDDLEMCRYMHRIGNPTAQDAVKVLVYNLLKNILGPNKTWGVHSQECCDRVMSGVIVKLNNRRFKSTVIVLTAIIAVLFLALIATLPASTILLTVVACAIPILVFTGLAGKILDLIDSHLSWTRSCYLEACITGNISAEDEDSIFLDLPYIYVLYQLIEKRWRLDPSPFSQFKNGETGIASDIEFIEQTIFNELVQLAGKIHASRKNSRKPNFRSDEENRMYGLISISVHLCLFGSKRTDDLRTQKDIIAGLYNRAFIALGDKRYRTDARSGIPSA